VLFACLAFSVVDVVVDVVVVAAVVWLLPPPECAADFSMSASRSSSNSGMPPIFHSSSYSKFVSFDSLELEELLLLDVVELFVVVVFAFPLPPPINSTPKEKGRKSKENLIRIELHAFYYKRSLLKHAEP